MKDNNKSRFSKEKLSKFFDKEGFYIILFLCVCVVAITAVWVSRSGVKDNTNPDTSSVKENQTTVNTPAKDAIKSNDEKGQANTANNTKTSTPQSQSSPGSKPTSSSTAAGTTSKTASVPSTFKLDSPFKNGVVKEGIMRDYSPEDPVCFEYPNYEWRTHAGLDLKTTEGTEVLAAADGKVVDIRDDNELPGGLGWTVVVDHNNGYRTVYANLGESLSVKKNQTVKKGERLGVVGSTSIYEMDSTATLSGEPALSHLHFEVLKLNSKTYNSVDPKQNLTMQN